MVSVKSNETVDSTLAPIELVILQGTSYCNLNCGYCDLTVESRRTKASMSRELIEKAFSDLFQSAYASPEITVVWHSGEPLTLPPAYYDEAIDLILELRSQFAGDTVRVRFSIQTNGVLIDEAWCDFFARHRDILDLGISCDGPDFLHDRHRVNWAGHATHQRTLRGMDLLAARGIRFKAIAVVTKETLRHADAFYRFFLERRKQLSGFHFNILAEGGSSDPALAYTPQDRQAYYRFYRRLLELGRVAAACGEELEILNFSQGFARVTASPGGEWDGPYRQTTAPLRSVSIDTKGNLTTFYAGLSAETLPNEFGDGQGFALGNLWETPFEDMVLSEKFRRIQDAFALSARTCHGRCEYFGVCPGGFEISKKRAFRTFEAAETVECLIHVKTFTDALLDDIEGHLETKDANEIRADSACA